mmetsp:Transcript_26753/g.87662  ORF Transcript_26753/g.87662 Transcript_26753/m.87662 type:complete len:99 (-) Transcript_26753:73-369(-)
MAPTCIAVFRKERIEEEPNMERELEDAPSTRLAVFSNRHEEDSSSSDEREEVRPAGKLKVFCPIMHAHFSRTSSMVRRNYNREIGALLQSEIDGKTIY